MKNEEPARPEFSRPLDLGRLGSKETEHDIEATEAERMALSERFGLVRIDSLCARVGLCWLGGRQRVRLRMRLLARVVQSCVVTLEPVENAIDETMEIFYEPVDEGATANEVVIATAADAEPLEGDTLDIGEIAAEELSLSLDPYPRKAGLEPVDGGAEAGEHGPVGGPFEDLARLKRHL